MQMNRSSWSNTRSFITGSVNVNDDDDDDEVLLSPVTFTAVDHFNSMSVLCVSRI